MPFDLGNLNDSYICIAYVRKTDPLDIYKFNPPEAGDFQVSTQNFRDDIDINLKNCETQVIQTVSVLGINPPMLSHNNSPNLSFSAEILPPAEDSNFIIPITPNSQLNFLSGMGLTLEFFVRKLTRKIGIYFAYNDGFHQDELAILPT